MEEKKENKKRLDAVYSYSEGNRYYELAKRLGTRKNLTSESLMDEFQRYVQFCVESPSPITMKVVNKKGGKGLEIKTDGYRKIAPMSLTGFCVWVGHTKSWFATTLTNLTQYIEEGKATEDDIVFAENMQLIKTFVETQMMDGAILGDYHAGIVGNLLGVKNNIDITSDGKAMEAPIINIIKDTKTREEYGNE